jgi:hypothetical protein
MLLERSGVGDWGSARVATEKMYLPTNPGQASKAPRAMTVAQIDQALRDFILQDTAHLRREAETENPEISQRELATPQIASEFVRHMAGASLTKLDETIVDLSQLRDFLHAESERIKREISSYLQFNHIAISSTRSVVDNIAQWKSAAHGVARAPEQSDFVGSEISAPLFPFTAADVIVPTK